MARITLGLLILLGLVAPPRAVFAQTVIDLHDFNPVASGTDGGSPWAGLVQGSDGNFYGTTVFGGVDGNGTAFQYRPSTHLFRTLHSFTGGSDGGNLDGGLVEDSNDHGTFYGTTGSQFSGGEGTVFKITSAGTLTTLHPFAGLDGSNPTSTLVQGSDGNFYGTTQYGDPGYHAGNPTSGDGTIFSLSPTGVLIHSYAFTGVGSVGANPYAGVVQGTDGNFYGTTQYGGLYGYGTVFRYNPTTFVLSTLWSFSGTGLDGGIPEAGLVQGNDGNFYGTTYEGGASTWGTVFQINPTTNVLTTVYSFTDSSDGANPNDALIQGDDGNLYGTAQIGGANGAGTIFKVNPTTGSFTSLYSFVSGAGSDGANPEACLVQGNDGNFYGTALQGGLHGAGTVYEYQLTVPPPTSTVWTRSYNNARTGATTSETSLNTTDVNVNYFGKLFTCPVDGQLYGQPLYVPGVVIGSHKYNIMYICSMENSVYAYNADNGTLLWHIQHGAPVNSDTVEVNGCTDITGDIGILSTPVIDASTNTLYYVEVQQGSPNPIQTLHAVDLATGNEKFSGPETIAGSYGGVTFSPTLNNQRAALTLSGGTVYIAWSSHCDNGDYHGFVMGYNASNVTNQQFVWADTTGSGDLGGIWMTGQGLNADLSGNLYLPTGNGGFDGTSNFGDSLLKLPADLSGPLDYFTPSNQATLAANDLDLGSAGQLLTPAGDIVGGGKDGRVFLVNVTNMGKYHAVDDVLQWFQETTSEKLGTPLYWNSPSGPTIYDWPTWTVGSAYAFNGTVNTTPVSQSTFTAWTSNLAIALSANGSDAGTGILWLEETTTLHALDATNLANEIWNSNMNASRDSLGNSAQWTPPTVANGKVYVSTDSDYVAVYGLLPGHWIINITTGISQIALNWQAIGLAVGYNVYRGTVAGGESTTPIAQDITTTGYTDTDVTPGGTYYYTAAAISVNGTQFPSGEVSATLPPAAPTGVTATATAATGGAAPVTVTWTASYGATGYNVYRGTTLIGTTGTAGSTASTGAAMVFIDAGAVAGAVNSYTVTAINAGGTSPASNAANVLLAPAPAAGLTATSLSSDAR